MKLHRTLSIRFVELIVLLSAATVLVNLLSDLILSSNSQLVHGVADVVFMALVAGPMLHWQLGIRARQVEAERTRKLQDLAIIAEKTVNAVVITDERGLISWVNEGFTRITGHAPAEVIGQKPGRLLQGPETDPAKVDVLRQAVRAGRSATVELVNYHKSGRPYLIHIELMPRHHPDGSIAGFMAIESDVTEQYNMTQVVRESERRFRTMADSAPLFIWMTDATGQCTYFNKPWLDFTGVSLDMALGEGWEHYLHPDDAAHYRSLFRDAMQDHKPFTVELRLRRRDGEYRTLHRRAVPRFRDDGSFEGFVGACTDITEIRQASVETEKLALQLHAQTMALELERERLDIALSSTGLGMWDWSPQTDAVCLDARWVRIVGEESLSGHFDEWLNRMHPDDLPAALEAYGVCSEGVGRLFDVVHRLKHSKGHWIWAHSRGVVVAKDDLGRPTRIVGTLQDITERHLMQQSVIEANATLEAAEAFAQMGNWSLDLQSGKVRWSDQVFNLFGRDPTLGTPDYESILSDFVTEDAERLDAAVKNAIERGESYVLTLKTQAPKNDVRYMRAEGRPCTDGCGHISGLFGIVMDVTEEVERVDALHEARRVADDALRESEALRHTLDQHAIFSVADTRGRITDINDTFCKISGYTRAELIGRDHRILNSGVHPKSFWVEMWKTLALGRAWHGDVCNRAKDGSVYWVDSIIAPFKGADGKIEKYVSIRTDITARKQAETERAALLKQQRLLLESTGEGIFGLDLNGNCTFINGAAARILGFSVDELIGFNLHERFHHHRATGAVYPQSQSPIYQTLRTGRSCREADEVFWRKDGTQFPVEYASYPIVEDGKVTGTVTTFSDITERKRMEEELRTAARTDRLTGLPNRELVSDRLQQAVHRAKRMNSYRFAVLFLDFDRFKTINDSLGHDVGDQLLKEIATRLRQTVRPHDSLTRAMVDNASARLGGDEFVVILDGISKPSDATVVADRLLEVFSRPYRLGEHEVYSTASIGIVTSDVSCDSADGILRDADTAMYEAKLAGKGQYVVFDVTMRQRAQKRLNIENDLRRALASNQLHVMYQPIVSLQTGQIESFEALVRWTHPDKGAISPGEFIPVAEDTGLIVAIGEWVLREACTQFASWKRTMGDAAPVSISVNLSRNQLGLTNLPAMIMEVLEETGVAPQCLHLEVTESAVMKDAEAAIQMLHQIKALGVKLDMDDFGTGHSSLSCLHQFPIDVLKIDRSFVANIDRGRDFAALVHAVAQLARNLNIKVVAEGIETLDQAMVLQSLDCEFGQGYLFSKPLRSEDVKTFRVPTASLQSIAA